MHQNSVHCQAQAQQNGDAAGVLAAPDLLQFRVWWTLSCHGVMGAHGSWRVTGSWRCWALGPPSAALLHFLPASGLQLLESLPAYGGVGFSDSLLLVTVH